MELKINDNLFKVKVLLDKNSQRIGMMHKTFDETFNGLLFFMENKKNNFWMKNCIIPLDIIFIDGNFITKICPNCPPCVTENCETYSGEGSIILEVLGGTCQSLGINIGNKVEFLFS